MIHAPIFTYQDLEDASKSHDVKKAIGSDEFDTKEMKPQQITKYCCELAVILNTGDVLDYLKKAKVIMLSKKAGSVCHIEDTRGI